MLASEIQLLREPLRGGFERKNILSVKEPTIACMSVNS